jgi:hypothetical protein
MIITENSFEFVLCGAKDKTNAKNSSGKMHAVHEMR